MTAIWGNKTHIRLKICVHMGVCACVRACMSIHYNKYINAVISPVSACIKYIWGIIINTLHVDHKAGFTAARVIETQYIDPSQTSDISITRRYAENQPIDTNIKPLTGCTRALKISFILFVGKIHLLKAK
jgi:hypothetical protein